MANFTDDIPEARRETLSASAEPTLAKSSSNLTPWLLLALAVLGLGGAGFWWLRLRTPLADGSTPEPTATTGSAVAAEEPSIATTALEEPPIPPSSSEPSSEPTASETPETSDSLLGHRPYPIADPSTLVSLSTNSLVLLKPEVAQKVENMIAEAGAAGVSLGTISGFRTLEDQKYLFFEVKAERGQTTQTRAEVSAPPGYSEHHTGYAVDFIDDTRPATDLNATFEETPAFQWLEKNAAYYGFEMSFPKGNKQNVAYEPWHWRYVGNQESLELFYQNQP